MKHRIIIASALLLVGGLIGNYFRFVGNHPDRQAEFSTIPLQVQGYAGREEFFDQTTYEVLNATSTTMKRYQAADSSVNELFVAYFESQRFGAGIHSPRHCLPGGGWQIEAHEAVDLNVPGAPSRTVNRLRIAFGEHESLMLYWYQTRSRVVRDEYGLKLDLLQNALAMRPTDAALVRITVPLYEGNVDEAMARAVRFAQVIDPYVQSALPFGVL